MSEETSSVLTTAQEQALEQATNLLQEHFEKSVILIETTINSNEDANTRRIRFDGGYSAAIGLCHWAEYQITTEGLGDDEED